MNRKCQQVSRYSVERNLQLQKCHAALLFLRCNLSAQPCLDELSLCYVRLTMQNNSFRSGFANAAPQVTDTPFPKATNSLLSMYSWRCQSSVEIRSLLILIMTECGRTALSKSPLKITEDQPFARRVHALHHHTRGSHPRAIPSPLRGSF
jgi:hypothetical protein